MSPLAVLLLSVATWCVALGLLRCADDDDVDMQHVRYFRIKSCHKLNSSVIARAPLAEFAQCAAFAAERRALAFNYSPYRARRGTFNCEVLGCPDLDGGTAPSLVNDSRYDYYTLYGNTLEALANASCVPGVGVFAVRTVAQNYTSAQNVCAAEGGRLAHVVTERRTLALAALLTERLLTWTKAAYVGLQVAQPPSAGATTVTHEPLDCYGYRAWAPGHPRRRRRHRCVLLDNAGLWRTVNCENLFPFLCEIQPEPPYYRQYQLYANTTCSNIRNRSKL